MVFHRRKLKDRVQCLVDEVLHMLQQESAGVDLTCRPVMVQAARLEDRILMSASPVAMVVDAVAGMSDSDASLMESEAAESLFEATILEEDRADDSPWSELSTNAVLDDQAFSFTDDDVQVTDPDANSDGDSASVRGPELVVIDYRVHDADTLFSELFHTDRDFRILRLDSDTDGISQITEKLEQVGNVSAIHLLTHGRDGSLVDTQAIEVTVTPVNDNTPIITSNGGRTTTSISVAENSTSVTTVIATDADLPAQTLTYSISGGADAARFTINSSTGALKFVSAPDYETPADSGANRVYKVVVRVSDGTLTDTQEIAVSVTDVNERPVANAESYSVNEDTPLTIGGLGVLANDVDPDNDALTAVLIDGASHGSLTTNANGRFVYQPNAGYFGADFFTYAGTDGVQVGATATASLDIIAPFSGTGGSGSGGSGGSSGSGSSSGSTSGSGSNSASGSSAPGGTGASGGSTSSQTSGGTGAQSQSTGAGSSSPSSAGTPPGTNVMTQVTTATSASASIGDEDALIGLYNQKVAAAIDILQIKPSISDGSIRQLDRDESRRSDSSDTFAKGRNLFYSNWDSRSELTTLELQRQQMYRDLSVQASEQVSFFEEKLTRNVRLEGRVVGSVGVVTTGFSVGYLIWAVRGGMLLSGFLSQIPAWTLLDPLLVIDGDGKDDDKESLQTIVDRQQAKLNTDAVPPDPVEPVDD